MTTEDANPNDHVEAGNINSPRERPDMNVYQHVKNVGAGMMNVSLFSANANQLRNLLDSYGRHRYYHVVMVFLSWSLIIQITIAVLMVWNAKYNVGRDRDVYKANRINNHTVILIFIEAVVNVFISAFEVADPNPPCRMMKLNKSNYTSKNFTG